jgi:hypothetical protein
MADTWLRVVTYLSAASELRPQGHRRVLTIWTFLEGNGVSKQTPPLVAKGVEATPALVDNSQLEMYLFGIDMHVGFPAIEPPLLDPVLSSPVLSLSHGPQGVIFEDGGNGPSRRRKRV